MDERNTEFSRQTKAAHIRQNPKGSGEFCFLSRRLLGKIGACPRSSIKTSKGKRVMPRNFEHSDKFLSKLTNSIRKKDPSKSKKVRVQKKKIPPPALKRNTEFSRQIKAVHVRKNSKASGEFCFFPRRQ